LGVLYYLIFVISYIIELTLFCLCLAMIV